MGKPEANFQKNFIDALKDLGFQCIRSKASGNVNKGKPDYAIFYKKFWGWLEFKRSVMAEVQPGQSENIAWAKRNSYGAFVFPANANEIMAELYACKRYQDEH